MLLVALNNPFSASTLIQSIIGKYNEVKDETIWELLQVSGSKTLGEAKEKGYNLQMKTAGTKTTISLHHSDQHVLTYIIYYDYENHKIRRKRLVNNLEEEDE